MRSLISVFAILFALVGAEPVWADLSARLINERWSDDNAKPVIQATLIRIKGDEMRVETIGRPQWILVKRGAKSATVVDLNAQEVRSLSLRFAQTESSSFRIVPGVKTLADSAGELLGYSCVMTSAGLKGAPPKSQSVTIWRRKDNDPESAKLFAAVDSMTTMSVLPTNVLSGCGVDANARIIELGEPGKRGSTRIRIEEIKENPVDVEEFVVPSHFRRVESGPMATPGRN